ncbi:hypothetical protein C2869_16920 [Saccharobesus litoralis]|uniref:Uncharacterized protein n=1 Tax=Saccharobesus litoralis TaxID=2172099 RepID=A0A2S0VV11_9ALTE|nr:ankyrin repeat domain-containing protein [Saccharobesus litoralis]AWB68002.1 hypothetical protein C2869_16920 [Saccharobesus litoralis]
MRHPLIAITFIALLLSLIACGPKPWDEPPLHAAAMSGDLEEVKTLISQGTKVDSRNKQGATPLHWAAFKGHVDVAQYLVKKGANVNAVTDKGSTPLRLATTHKQQEMIQFLKRKGGKI